MQGVYAGELEVRHPGLSGATTEGVSAPRRVALSQGRGPSGALGRGPPRFGECVQRRCRSLGEDQSTSGRLAEQLKRGQAAGQRYGLTGMPAQGSLGVSRRHEED